MLKSIALTTCACITLGMVGCATTSNPATDRNLDKLQNKNWVASEIQGVKLEANPANSNVPTIAFDDTRVSGSDGCNRFMGGYTVQDTKIQFSNLASTQRACLTATNIPQSFNQALSQVTHYDASKDHLKFLDTNNKVVLQFENVK
ncbi:META domain-containing protein [Acinetobacter sp. ANC 5054]|uniref:META domain-containing protein n=1 Tax=Acinetobacter sp. ANC 5054 TaxID=1977877 RepID=UPI000A349799|nr:META domain-containing protein [Acinetobacter sp. ANC 5054]OTG83495.1 META domain-containing protein [Acinetobacter sp. ANC 5054]